MRYFFKIIFFFVLIMVILGVYFSVKYWDSKSRNKNLSNLIGTYMLDINKTNLGNYKSEVDKFKNLRLFINPNYTFKFNMKVPFIYDSIGTWKSAGSSIDEWNMLYYESWDYSGGVTGEQITRCCEADSTVYLNSVTPQKGYQLVEKIWFKKISSSSLLSQE